MKVSMSGVGLGLAIALVSAIAGGIADNVAGTGAAACAIVASMLLVLVATRSIEHAATAAVATTLSLGWVFAVTVKLVLVLPLASMNRFGSAVALESFPVHCGMAFLMSALLAFPVAFVVRMLSRAMLPAAILVALAATAMAALGLRSLSRPEPDDFTRLFASTTVQAGQHATVNGVTVDNDVTVPSPVLADRHCVARVSGVEIGAPLYGCPALSVRADPQNGDVLVFVDVHAPPLTMIRKPGASDTITISDLHGRLGAPRGWIVSAIGSLAIAIAAIAVAFQARRPIAGGEGHHEGDGWIRVAGAPRFADALVNDAPGPIVVFDDASAPPTYRDDGVAKVFIVKRGTLATLRDEQRARVASWACVAIAPSVLGFVPLWIAHVHGLL